MGSLAQRPLSSLDLSLTSTLSWRSTCAPSSSGSSMAHVSWCPAAAAASSAWPASPACSAASPSHPYNVSKSALVGMVSVVAAAVVVSRHLRVFYLLCEYCGFYLLNEDLNLNFHSFTVGLAFWGFGHTRPLNLWKYAFNKKEVGHQYLHILLVRSQHSPLNYVVVPYNGSLPQLVSNPYSWTKMANFLYLDSPVGSGFSYARDPKGYDVGDYSSSSQVVTFLTKWFNDHPQYLSNPFYVGGSSYAGKVSPIIANYILEEIEERHHPLINLKGYIVGNPITGSNIEENFRVPYAHGVGIISDQQYEIAVESCKGDYVTSTNKICAEVMNVIQKLISEVSLGHIMEDKCVHISPKPINDEHIQLRRPPPRHGTNCFTYKYYLSYFWANYKGSRDALGIREGTVNEWVRCNFNLPYVSDVPSNIDYHHNLTSKGYRALVYSGDHDLLVPFLSTHSWIRSFNYPIVDDWRAWHLDGQAAGFTIKYNNLTFATLKGAGHTAVEYEPKRGFAMAQRWIDNMSL
uniref:Uncharacterized protein n=1 Tax=Oryza brachyantha TaxID=4533 RepID=J3LSI0_ORYBR